MAKRAAIRPKDRFEIFKRDGFVCQYCGRTPPTVVLELDHIVAVASGGGNELDNLLTACADCNIGKGARALEIVPESLEVSIEQRKERALQVKEYNDFLMQQREEESRTVERIGTYWFDHAYGKRGHNKVFGSAREPSIRRFLVHLTEAEMLDSIDIAFGRFPYASAANDQTPWKYFCGICWRRIRERRGEE